MEETSIPLLSECQ